MNGHQPIVLVISNHHYYEHDTVRSAHAEANRLAQVVGRDAVVYVPVAYVNAPRAQHTDVLLIDPNQLRLQLCGREDDDDDLPF